MKRVHDGRFDLLLRIAIDIDLHAKTPCNHRVDASGERRRPLLCFELGKVPLGRPHHAVPTSRAAEIEAVSSRAVFGRWLHARGVAMVWWCKIVRAR